MASYFLPSYFQKRLLRYALSRLDFLETEALDLENLGITFGQRSVVELKSVGIQVKKLAAVLPLPPTVNLTRARIRLLRLTIPADLNNSGIVAEIEGIDVQIEFRGDDTSGQNAGTQNRAATAPSRGTKANRPRTASPVVHDPGGQAIPSTQDLAVSFLQSEPTQEREELQAAIASRSQHLHESTLSSSTTEDDVGLGLPGGISLPTFVANFFKGVMDRMSVEIRDVSVTVDMELPQDGTTVRDSVHVTFRMAELALNGVQAQQEDNPQLDGRRTIEMHKIEVALVSEPELLLAVSAASSPKLSKSRSKLPSTGSRSSIMESEAFISIDRDLSRPTSYPDSVSSRSVGSNSHSEWSSDSSPAFASTAGLGLQDVDVLAPSASNMVDSTHSAQVSELWVGGRGQDPNNLHDIDNQAHAEQLARKSTLDSSVIDRGLSGTVDPEDLSESKFFTHDEAESMYLSAVGVRQEAQGPSNTMPGGWDWSSSNLQNTEAPLDRPDVLSQSVLPVPTGNTPSEGFEAMSRNDLPLSPRLTLEPPQSIDKVYEQPEPASNLVQKRIFFIDNISIYLPTPGLEQSEQQMTDTLPGQPQLSPRSEPRTRLVSNQPALTPFASQLFLSQALLPGEDRRPLSSGSVHELSGTEANQQIKIRIGDVSVMVDLPVGKLLVRICREVLWAQPAEKRGERSQGQTALPAVDIQIRTVKLNVCENVPALTSLSSPEQSVKSKDPDSLLLQLSFLALRWATMNKGDRIVQQLTAGRVAIGHESNPLLYFKEDIRSSVGPGTTPLQDDVIVLLVSGEPASRIEVRLKPMHVVLDLLQLDDVLSRSGGLSSILELGNSITSTSTVRGGSPRPKPLHTRQRSVRFESQVHQSSTTDPIPVISGKIDVRLAGLTLDLVGSETAMQVRTTAIKLAYRQNIAGLQIDRVVVVGPTTPGSKLRGDIEVNMTNIRAQFLAAPEESDLDRLITLLTPSKDKYDDDDDIMVETLLRQRRKGSVLRLTVSEFQSVIDGLAWQDPLTRLVDELSKLSSVTKYLPDDDRPGILIFLLVKKVGIIATPDRILGPLQLRADLFEAGHVNVPSLTAVQASMISLHRNDTESVIGEVVSRSEAQSAMALPMLMCRFIADEMEPKVRFKLSNVCVEYRVSTLMAITDMIERLRSASQPREPLSPIPSPSSSSSEVSAKQTKQIGFSVTTRDSAIGLSPLATSAKGLVLLTDATFANSPGRQNDNTASLDIKKASIMVINDFQTVESGLENADHKLCFDESDQMQQLVQAGFVPVGYISAASAIVSMSHEKSTNEQNLDIEFRNNLFILETCADSTQTLIQILGSLSLPSAPSKVSKYRTEIVPIEDMLASFTGDAYVTSPGPDVGLRVFAEAESMIKEDPKEEVDDDETAFFPADLGTDDDEMAESYVDSELAESTMSASIAPVGITESVTSASHESVMMHSLLDFRSEHFAQKSTVGGTAHRWNSTQNTYGLGTERGVKQYPLKVRVRDVHIIWNLFDGYDWQSTRDTISQAVKDIETKAASRRPRSNSQLSPRAEDDGESVIGDFLFNSIYIGIPASKNPSDLANAINHNIDDLASETGSYTTSTTVTASPTRRPSFPRTRQQKLRLTRSKHHKMTFELKGISADFLVFPPGIDEIESSVDIRVKDLEVFDHVPTSTWKKFATYMQDAGEREVDTNMLHLEILNVKPVADLNASEMVLKITILPLRLHVDQDALDFMTRFFEFKDDEAPVSTTPSTPPFLQRVEVNPVRLRLDFKPKRVDYGGLRSGRTTEFMNFFVLDRADIMLRRVILYGVSGFDRLGIMLNNIWTPDVKRNQLPGILRSLGPIRPLTDVGSGLRELIVVPMREYKKDGRIVRSIQKGALAFATTTAKELVNFGAKLAIGTQTILQNAETMLAPGTEQDKAEFEDESKKQISLYADQPIGIVQGLRGAYASLERDLLLAKDAIIAVPGEVMASGSATGAAKAVLRSSPTIILRPAIGASKAVGQTLLGAGNAMDRRNLRRMEEKYKHGR